MRLVLIILAYINVSLMFAQAPKVDFLGQLSYNEKLSDVWGFEKCGKEYAIVGVKNGVSIVDVTDPTDPVELFFEPGAYTSWRDMKTWNDYAYIVNEGSGGLMIIDLSDLPFSVNTYSWTSGLYNGSTLSLSTAHNLFIDENGIAYLCGANLTFGAFYLDLNVDPINPPIIGKYDNNYVHDLFVRDNIMWTAEFFQGRIVAFDINDKENEIPLGFVNTPQAAAHNVWLSDDGKFMFTTDETAGGYIAAFNVEDPANMYQVGSYYSNPSSGSIPHNTFVKGNYLISSYYRDGVTVVDISDPSSMTQVDEYDTTPASGTGFSGCWGVYPYLPSGNILASDIDEGLFILGDATQVGQGVSLIGTSCDDGDSNTSNDQFIDEGCNCVGEQNINVNRLYLKVYLQGPLEDSSIGIPYMKNDLGAAGLIPLAEPYTNMPQFNHVLGGGETTTPSVINAAGNAAIVDWVYLELRRASDFEVVQTQSVLLRKDGNIVNADGDLNIEFTVPNGQYHISIKHRNHLGVMNQNPFDLSGDSDIFIDFTDVNTDTYGEFAQVVTSSNKQALWAGNSTTDSAITYQGNNNDPNGIFFKVLQDPSNPEAFINFILPTYSIYDLNMDGNVIYQGQNNDVNVVFFNILNSPNNTSSSSNFIIIEQIP